MKIISLLLIILFSHVQTKAVVRVFNQKKAIKKSINSVVFIEIYIEDICADILLHKHGSGVVFYKNGYIVTSKHLISGSCKINVISGEDTLSATLIGMDEKLDIAVIKVDKKLPVIDIGNSDNAALGDYVFNIGFPLDLPKTINMGIVCHWVDNYILDLESIGNYIGTDAVCNPGNSGGALIDSKGRLIGIVTMIYSHTGFYMGYSYAIPINDAKNSIYKIIINHKGLTIK